MKRVDITGMGAVTPIGNSVSAMWSTMRAGVCGIGPITKFDTADYKVKIAAELKDFDPSLVMEKSEVRKTDPFTRYALAAAAEAMAAWMGRAPRSSKMPSSSRAWAARASLAIIWVAT